MVLEQRSRPVGRLGRMFTRAVKRLQPELPAAALPARALGSAVTDCAVYVNGVRQGSRLDIAEAHAMTRRRRNCFVWLGLFEPGRAELAHIAAVFGLHELTVEKAATTGQRPTVEVYPDLTVLVLRTARYVEHAELTETSEVVDTG
jgi:magnesium transporter